MSASHKSPTVPGERERWSGQFGFIVSAVGSAIGLGNIWRFPGVAYTNGGGAFMIPYVIALLTAGIPILLLDYSIGHRYQGSAPTAFHRMKRWMESLGWLQVMICVVITCYYAVILAWAGRYFFFSWTKAWGDDPASFLTDHYLKVSDPGFNMDIVPGVFWALVALWIAVSVVMALGIEKGLERLNKIFIPILIAIFVALVLRALFLNGAMDGLNSLFQPNWAALKNPNVWVAAYGQIFFSLSVGFGIMLTYASYMKPKSNMVPTAFVTGFANSSFELLAGIGVFATLGFMASAQGVSISDLGFKGVSLAFITFPTVISMMPGGALFGLLFFASLFIAGFTSLVSLLQVISAALQEKFALGRRLAAVVMGGGLGLTSVIFFSTTNGLNALDVVDKFINEIGVVSAAVLECVLTVYVVKRLGLLRSHLNYNSTIRLGRWWDVTVGLVSPTVLVVTAVLVVIGLFRDGYEGYPTQFLYMYGWLMIVLVALISVALSFARWRTPVDDFNAMQFHSPAAAGIYDDSPDPARERKTSDERTPSHTWIGRKPQPVSEKEN
ncbi:MAG: sodium-dependent transporter [Actinomycetaceae bacterium]|nr:sodium-dependent transporter [Actinomycetaceae bacterium]MDY6083184.1 sodium-dependent transporter [Actinomycetaceae bacterium]